MPKIEQRLGEARVDIILFLWEKSYTVEEIGKILHLTISRVYAIIKENSNE